MFFATFLTGIPGIFREAVFFATLPTGIPVIPREAVFFATCRAAEDWEYCMETENLESSPRPVCTHFRHGYGPSATMGSPEDARVDEYMNKKNRNEQGTKIEV